MSSDVSYRLRYMQTSDIASVVSIDQQAFNTPWSVRAYVHEVTLSTYSHMLIVEEVSLHPAKNQIQALWWRILGRPPVQTVMLAYGGLWHLNVEGHISTIASHPSYRRQGWGELALIAMLLRSISLDVTFVALEVRVSNIAAQKLYERYGFVQRGIKKGYYSDNREDAYDMVLNLGDTTKREYIQARYADYCQRLSIEDTYSDGTRPQIKA